MWKLARPLRTIAYVVAMLTISTTTGQNCAAQAGGLQAEGAKFRLIRSVSGSKGTPQGGRFAMEDPRSAFYVPADRQVIVYMEWEGPVGKHHIEGFWRGPSGKISTMSDFDYEAKDKRFGAYWTLALADGAENGGWSLEAHIDGELAGTHAFQIVSSAKPGDAGPTRKMLTPAQLYESALQASATIEKFDRTGRKFGEGSGFLVAPNAILTAFECIDGAVKLRVKLANGATFETDQVSTWNRRQDWAVLRVNATSIAKLRAAGANSWNIGDIASYLESAPEGNRVLANVSIDGRNAFPGAGLRLNISAPATDRAIGSALLNEYGEVIGMVTGSLIPGGKGSDFSVLATPPGASINVTLRGGLAVPLETVGNLDAPTAETSLAALETKGEFLPAITAARNVTHGQFARTMDKKGGLTFPMDSGNAFSKKDATMYVYVMWEGQEKAKGALTLRLYDIDNRLLNKASLEKPMKFSIGKGEHKTTSWDIGIGQMPLGIYRADVWLDDAPAWRSFFRVAE